MVKEATTETTCTTTAAAAAAVPLSVPTELLSKSRRRSIPLSASGSRARWATTERLESRLSATSLPPATATVSIWRGRLRSSRWKTYRKFPSSLLLPPLPSLPPRVYDSSSFRRLIALHSEAHQILSPLSLPFSTLSLSTLSNFLPISLRKRLPDTSNHRPTFSILSTLLLLYFNSLTSTWSTNFRPNLFLSTSLTSSTPPPRSPL